MAYLARAKKIDLQTVTAELGLVAPDGSTKIELINIIVKSNGYDEELVKNLLMGIVSEREESETKLEEAGKKLEEAEKRAYEIKKLELQAAPASQNESSNSVSAVKNSDVLKLINKYDSREEISIYLTLFERQMKRVGIGKENWIAYLMGLLPLDIINIITREKEEFADDYDYIKQILLRRFKLTPEQFRQKFFSHKKENNASWKDYSFELSNFLEEWLTGLEILTYDQLKELLVIDQIRRKISLDMKEHFLDEMPKFTNITELVEKLDNYDTVRINIKKNCEVRNSNNEAKKHFSQNVENKNYYRNNNTAQNSKYEKYHNKTAGNNYTPFKIRCFYCNEYASHKSSQCPRRKEGNTYYRNRETGNKPDQYSSNNTKNVSTTNDISRPLDKITKSIEIKGKIVDSVVDSGSDVSIASDSLYKALGRPDLNENDIKLTGISGDEMSPIGFFNSDILIDDIVINSDIYVLKDLKFDMILGNNCLNKLNLEISDNGLKVTGKRNIPKKCSVNLISVVPKNIPKRNMLSINKKILVNSSLQSCVRATEVAPDNKIIRIPDALSLAPINCLSKSEINVVSNAQENYSSNISEIKPFYFAEVVKSINLEQLDVTHVTDSAMRRELIKLVKNYKPSKTKSVDLKADIILTDEIPVRQRPRRLAFAEQEIVDKQIQEWLAQGIIRESNSNYAAPIVLTKKKNGNLRLCIDYRKLNKKIIRDNYPLPLIDEVLDNIGQSQVFSTLDLKNGFFHVKVEEESKKFTSFVTNNSQFEYNFLPFGLSISPQKFQRYIYACLKELIRDKTILVYMDDIIVLAQSEEEALLKLKRVFKVASEYGLEFNFAKCQFLKRKIEFLGYVIENGTIRPSEAQTAAVEKFPKPQNKKQLQSFLGLTGYFRRYIADYAKIAKPLSDLLKTENEFRFGQNQNEAFNILKNKLANKPVLHIFRQGVETELHTDASSLGFGAVLLQKGDDSNLHPVYFMSRKTTPAQSKYSSYELEALAVIEALKKFRSYLLGNKFKIVTDCSAFQKTLEKKDLAPKVARWALYLQEFDYQIVHRAGNQMKHVDALSRNAVFILTRSHDEMTAKLAKAQNEDDYIRTIKELIDQSENKDYFIKHNIVYKYDNGRDLIVVPECMQKEIIRDIHRKGHYAIAKTEAMVKHEFYIPNLRKQTETVISNCVECILCNRKKGKGEGLLNPIPKQNFPLQTYHIDHLGPMPSTNKNYNYIFTVVDAFSKFVWLYPVKTTSAKEVISKLKSQQATFGNPARIISDRGTAFTSSDFKQYLEEENIEHILITTGIPRGNGQVERIQESLIPILTKLSIEDATKWYKFVPTVQRIINSTCSRSTKFTPFELLTGVKLKNKDDIKVRQILDEEFENAFVKERENSRELAKQNILKIQEENRRSFNRKRKRANCYKVGDLVAIEKTQFQVGGKLRPKFQGPYKVIKVKVKDRYDVEKVGVHEGPTTTSTAADHMKPWASEM